MRKFFLRLLLVCLLIQCGVVYAASYRDFHRALRSRRYYKARRIIRVLHQREPGSAKYRYWYGYLSYRVKRYATAVRILRGVRSEYRPLSYAYYYCRSLHFLKRRRVLVNALYKALRIPEKRKGYHHYFYTLLVSNLVELNSGIALTKVFKRAVAYYKRTPSRKGDYFFYKYGKWQITRAIRFLKQHRFALAKRYFNNAREAAKQKLARFRRYLRLYRYPDQLKRMKRYKEALAIYATLRPNEMSPTASFAYVDTLIMAKKLKQAKQILFSLINVSSSTLHQYSTWNWSRAIRQLLLLKQEHLASKFEPYARAAFRKKGKPFSKWILYHMVRAYMTKAVRLVGQGRDQAALSYIRLAKHKFRNGLGKYRKYISKYRLELYEIALRFWLAKRSQLSHAYKHRFFIVIFSDLNVRYVDHKGKRKHVIDHIPRSRVAEYKVALEMMRRLFYYYTRGKVNMRFDVRYHKSLVSEVRFGEWRSKIKGRNGKPLRSRAYYSPVLDSIKPHPGKLFFKNRKRFDTFLVVFPSKGVTGTSTGGFGRTMYVPYVLYSTPMRGRIHIAGSSFSERSCRLLTHEFFHSVEAAYAKRYRFTTHVFRKIYRAYWPHWYRGEGELAYYEYAFRNVIRPIGTRYLHYRAKRDNVTERDFQKAEKIYRKYSLARLKRADTLRYKGYLALRQRDNQTAFKYYLQSYKLFPENIRVVRYLAYLYYHRGQRHKSREMYIKIASLPGATPKEIRRAAVYLRRSGHRDRANRLRGSIRDEQLSSRGYYKKGRRLENKDKYAQAQRYYLASLRRFPGGDYAAYSLYRLVYSLFRYQKKYRQAVAYGSRYWRLVKRDRMARTIAFYLGRACGQIGQRGKALYWLRIAKRRGYALGTVRYYIRKYSR